MELSTATSDKQLFVRNLPYDCTEETLTQLFEEYGPIKNVSIVKDSEGSSRGFGFIKFSLGSDASTAYEKLNNCKVNGRSILIEFVKKSEPGPGKINVDHKQRLSRVDSNISCGDESLVIEDQYVNVGQNAKSSSDVPPLVSPVNVKKSRQILIFGVPLDVTKKMMARVVIKQSKKSTVELIKEV